MRGVGRFAALALAAALAAERLGAQTPAPGDTARRDSVVADTLRPFLRRDASGRPCEYQGVDMPLQLVVFDLAVAPPMLFGTPGIIMCRRDDRSGPTVGFSKNHLAVYGVAAENAAWDSSGAVWSGSAEALWRGVFAEYRVQSIVFPHRYAYHILHAGYLAHPWPWLMGGVTLGFRRVPALREHEGVEVAFPLVWGAEHGWARFESGYVVNRHMTSWNYRLQGEWPIRGGPFRAGFDVEAVTLPVARHSRPAAVPLGVLAGVSF